MIKIEKALLLVIVLALFVGAVSATETSQEDQHAIDETVASDTNTISHENEKITTNKENKIPDENKTHNIEKKTNIKQTTKTASNTYDVTDFDTLHDALTSDKYNTVTVNIKSDIKLTGSTEINSAIKKLTINGNGNTINGYQYQFLCIERNNNVIINNIRITNCYAGWGGAIYNKGTLTITNSTLNNNTAREEGGAINNWNYGTVTITNSTLTKNRAKDGGAIYNGNANLIITNSTLKNNKATEKGGAIYNSDMSKIINTVFDENNAENNSHDIYNDDDEILTLIQIYFYGKDKTILNQGRISLTENSTISNNIVNKGTIVYFNKLNKNEKNFTYLNNLIHKGQTEIKLDYDIKLDVFNDEEYEFPYGIVLDVNNIIINGNGHKINAMGLTRIFETTGKNITIKNIKLENGYHESGGAIYNDKGTLTINNSTLNNNTAHWSGGAIYNNEGTLTINNSILKQNTANSSGGAIMTYKGTLTITNSTLKQNKATQYGGAIYTEANITTIKNNNFEQNTAKEGAAIYNLPITDNENVLEGTLYVTNNTFNKNKANTTGKAIINNGTNTTIKKNINDTTSIYSSTIYIEGNNTRITNNIFDDKTINTKITINKIANTPYTNNATIKGTLKTTTGTPLKSTKITITVNGKKVGITKTNVNGTFTLKYTTKTPGKNNVTATYTGNTKYKTTTAKTTFTVTKRTTKATITKITQKTYKQNITITGKLTDKTGTLLKNVKIKVKVNNKTYTLKTNNKGIYTLKVIANKVGTNNVTVIYSGNKYYKAVTKKTTFKTVARATKITVNKINGVAKGKKVKITGKLTDNLKSSIMNSLVKIKINNKTVKVKTNKQGVYTYNYKTTTKGTNKVTITFSGSTNYKNTSVKTSFIVK